MKGESMVAIVCGDAENKKKVGNRGSQRRTFENVASKLKDEYNLKLNR